MPDGAKAGGIADFSGHVFTLDVGSSSVRCSLHDAEGNPVEGMDESSQYRLETTPDGGATLDAEELAEAIFGTMDASLAKVRDANLDVVAVAMSTFWHSTLGVDRHGRPTTPVFSWADRRAATAARELRERLNGRAVHQRTGCVLHSSYLPAKLLWLSRHAPEAFEETERFVSPGEYLYLTLFGEAQVGTSMASGTGLFDQNEKAWDEEVLGALPILAERLSPISDEPARGLRGDWARRWPELENAPWLPAVGDGACSNVGSGCATLERLALNVGTSGALRAMFRAGSAETPEGLWRYRASAERFVVGGALSDGGNLVAWLRETLRLPEPGETEALVSRMKPDAHGLTFLPLLAGERGPDWADEANGTVAGISMSTKPVEILRAAMEAVALRFALIAERLDEAFPEGAEDRAIVASGGGIENSPAWAGMVADALGKPVTVSGVAEASSRGAALLAIEALGGPKVEEFDAPLGETHEPDQERHEVYRGALERQKGLYEAVMRGSWDQG